MFLIRDDVIGPVMVFAIPIVAIAGGILASIVRTLSQHRLMETALRERMALIARGMDPEALSAATGRGFSTPALFALEDFARIRAQGLLIAGFVTLVAGVAYGLVVGTLDSWEAGDWALGVVAAAAGLALIASGWVVWPRGRHTGAGHAG
jgi:hypothetical protein